MGVPTHTSFVWIIPQLGSEADPLFMTFSDGARRGGHSRMLVCWFGKTSDFHARNNAKACWRSQTAPPPAGRRAMPRHAATSQPPSRRAPAQRRHRRCRWPPWPESTAASSWRPLNSAGRAAAECSEEDGGQHLVCGNEGHETLPPAARALFWPNPAVSCAAACQRRRSWPTLCWLLVTVVEPASGSQPHALAFERLYTWPTASC